MGRSATAGGAVDALDIAELWRRGCSRGQVYRALDRLAARRAALGIAPGQVARRVGVSRRRLRHIDAGEVGYGELARYALALGYRLVVTVALPGDDCRRGPVGEVEVASPTG